MNLSGATGGERLTGGVSSDIWRIDLPSGPICVKRALEKLRVAAGLPKEPTGEVAQDKGKVAKAKKAVKAKVKK